MFLPNPRAMPVRTQTRLPHCFPFSHEEAGPGSRDNLLPSPGSSRRVTFFPPLLLWFLGLHEAGWFPGGTWYCLPLEGPPLVLALALGLYEITLSLPSGGFLAPTVDTGLPCMAPDSWAHAWGRWGWFPPPFQKLLAFKASWTGSELPILEGLSSCRDMAGRVPGRVESGKLRYLPYLGQRWAGGKGQTWLGLTVLPPSTWADLDGTSQSSRVHGHQRGPMSP